MTITYTCICIICNQYVCVCMYIHRIGSTECADDGAYADPQFQDTCAGWSQYECTGFWYSDELIAACPLSCNACEAGADSTAGGTSGSGGEIALLHILYAYILNISNLKMLNYLYTLQND